MSTKRTDGQPSPLDGHIVPSCLGNDMAPGKAVRELGQGRPFPIASPGLVMALQYTLLSPGSRCSVHPADLHGLF